MIDYNIPPESYVERVSSPTTTLLNYLGLTSNTEPVNQEINPTNISAVESLLNSLSNRQRVVQAPYTPNTVQQSPINYSGSDNSALTQSLNMIREHEGFKSNTYWDVNAHRLGYGSDTITNLDGSIRKVKKGDTVTREQAELDLRRRTQEFMNSAANSIGRDYFNKLPSSAQASLTSLTYNYGSLNKLPNVIKAARSGNLMELSRTIENLGSHNKGINRKRRLQEAQYVLLNR